MARAMFDSVSRALERFAHWTTVWVGSSWAFLLALAITILWLVTGPIYRYSDTWQLVMNTLSSIVTFLMVFLLQRSQNKDSAAMQVKLDELLATQKGASNRLISVEDLSEKEVHDLHERYQQLCKKTGRGAKATAPVSIENERGSSDREREN
jgi:low affinity Fe/Cu permease